MALKKYIFLIYKLFLKSWLPIHSSSLQLWTKCTVLIASTKLIEKTFRKLLFVVCNLYTGQPSVIRFIFSNQSTIIKAKRVSFFWWQNIAFIIAKLSSSSILIVTTSPICKQHRTVSPFSLTKSKLAYSKNDSVLLLGIAELSPKSLFLCSFNDILEIRSSGDIK